MADFESKVLSSGRSRRVKTLSSRLRGIAFVDQLGPGLITGAADDDPSGIATYSQAGAQFGYGLLWTMLLTFPLMSAVQLICAQIGRVTGKGLAANMVEVLPGLVVDVLLLLLFVANTINIGADLAAMGDAVELSLGWNAHAMTALLAFVSLALQMFVPYRRYANVLKYLTMVLLAYVAVLVFVNVDWSAAAHGLVVPSISGREGVLMVVAVFGTTISPYLFFWQSAQEVEELDQDPKAKPLVDAPWQARRAFGRMRLDTIVGMAASNLIALAIMVATAATLHATGTTSIGTAADAARALEPVAGRFAFELFALGIVGTGLLAVPVLAGSAAYAVGESRGWKTGLDQKPWEAYGFYAVIAAATLLGIAIDWSPIDPIKALFWSAVINGIVAVPIMAAMMFVASKRQQMGRFTISRRLVALGWAATAVMATAVVGMAVVR